jgi:hypothetical protein
MSEEGESISYGVYDGIRIKLWSLMHLEIKPQEEITTESIPELLLRILYCTCFYIKIALDIKMDIKGNLFWLFC